MMSLAKLSTVAFGLALALGSVAAQGTVILNPITLVDSEIYNGVTLINLDVDLTSVGTVDWRDFRSNNGAGDRKNTVTDRISTLTTVDGSQNGVANDSLLRTSWTDGSPTSSDSFDPFFGKMHISDTSAAGGGWQFTVSTSASTNYDVLYVYAVGWNSKGLLTVTLDTQTQTMQFDAGNLFGAVFRIEFYADTVQNLTVKYGFDPADTQPDTSWSNLSIKAAALQEGEPVPEPASFVLLSIGGLMLMARRRRITTGH